MSALPPLQWLWLRGEACRNTMVTRMPTGTRWQIVRPLVLSELIGLIELLLFDLVCAAADNAEYE